MDGLPPDSPLSNDTPSFVQEDYTVESCSLPENIVNGGYNLQQLNRQRVEKLTHVLKERSIIIEYVGAELLVREAWYGGTMNTDLIDRFYELIVSSGGKAVNDVHVVTAQYASELLTRIKAQIKDKPIVEIVPTEIINAFNIKRHVWNVQQQVIYKEAVAYRTLHSVRDWSKIIYSQHFFQIPWISRRRHFKGLTSVLKG